MKDWPEIHRTMAEREGRELLIPDASKEIFENAARNGEIPRGSIWLWSMGAYGPAKPKKQWRDGNE